MQANQLNREVGEPQIAIDAVECRDSAALWEKGPIRRGRWTEWTEWMGWTNPPSLWELWRTGRTGETNRADGTDR